MHIQYIDTKKCMCVFVCNAEPGEDSLTCIKVISSPWQQFQRLICLHLYLFSWFVLFRVKIGAGQNRSAVLGVSFWSCLPAEELIEPCWRNRLHRPGQHWWHKGCWRGLAAFIFYRCWETTDLLGQFRYKSSPNAALMLPPRVRYQWGLTPEFLTVRTLKGDFHHQMHWFFCPKALKTTRRFSSA